MCRIPKLMKEVIGHGRHAPRSAIDANANIIDDFINKIRGIKMQGHESTLAIANECQKLDPDGITVVPFVSSFTVYESTTPAKVKDIFKENQPNGSTYLAPVLQATFDSYLSRKKAGTAKTNGELILVVTDGCPSDEAEVAKAITNFTKKLDHDEEYGISFIQVGKDGHASQYAKSIKVWLQKKEQEIKETLEK